MTAAVGQLSSITLHRQSNGRKISDDPSPFMGNDYSPGLMTTPLMCIIRLQNNHYLWFLQQVGEVIDFTANFIWGFDFSGQSSMCAPWSFFSASIRILGPQKTNCVSLPSPVYCGAQLSQTISQFTATQYSEDFCLMLTVDGFKMAILRLLSSSLCVPLSLGLAT